MKYENNVPVFGPGFFDSFHCIADRCSMTCCREWTIPVDDRTLHRWEKVSMEGQMMIRNTERGEDGRYRIRLRSDHRCPWLDAQGLCRVVLTHGDEMLSTTCASFPRQQRRYEDRIERSLLTGCPAVLDLLTGECPIDMDEPVERLAVDELLDADDRLTLPALRLVRRLTVSILLDEAISMEAAMVTAFRQLRDLWEYEAEPRKVMEILTVMADPEQYRSPMRQGSAEERKASRKEQNELFLDLCENYHREGKYAEILAELVAAAEAWEPEESASGEMSEVYDRLFRRTAACDCMAGLLSEKPDLTGLLVNYQWILLRFTGIRQALRLCRRENSDSEKIKKIICVFERMTGFSDADIRETLRTMFDEILWETGYVELLMGE